MILAVLCSVMPAMASPEPCPPREGIYVNVDLDPLTRAADQANRYRIGLPGRPATLAQLMAHTGHAERARHLQRSRWARRLLTGTGVGLLGMGGVAYAHTERPPVAPVILWTIGALGIMTTPFVGRSARRLPPGELARIVDGHNRELLATRSLRGTPPHSRHNSSPCR